MLRKLRKRRRAGWELGKAGPFFGPPASVDTLLGSVYLAVMSLRERTRPGLALNELTPRYYRAPASQCGNSPSSQPRRGRQDSRRSSEDSRHNGDAGIRSGHKNSGSTALVDILQLPDHFEPWLSWLRPTIRRPQGRSVPFSS